MSRYLKPLFRTEVLRDRLRNFVVPEELAPARERLASLHKLIAESDPRRLREEHLKPGFIVDVLGGLLGYRTPNQSADAFTMVPEFCIPGGRGVADVAIGTTPRDGRGVLMAVEIKAPGDPLDIPHAGRRLSAVEQGFDYAINFPCDWVLVTSMVETRLYHKANDRFTCERFDLHQLVQSELALRRFVYILGAERVVPAYGRSHLYDLAEESRIAGENITREFYAEYSRIRLDCFHALIAANPDHERTTLLSLTQKILDRIIFCAFAEDRGLMPANTLDGAYKHINPYNPGPRWANFVGLFRAIDQGNDALRIARYNGGLFAADPMLDSLVVPDAVCASFRRLAEFDFRDQTVALHDDLIQPAPAMPAPAQVDVEILGHIFEQSITDLERLRLELEGLVEAPDPARAKSKRKKEGAFYTPKFITRYIVEQTLGPVLADRLEALRQRHSAEAKPAARKALEAPATYELAELKPAPREALLAFWSDWQAELGRIRILDPACGSGAFLIEAFDQLLAAYQEANARVEALRGAPELFDLNRLILQQNLYGVDVNEEAVEICRLSLWIKTAEHGKVLTDLDHTIRVGNSIVGEPAVHPRAFDWHATFPEVFAAGGFDVVVGNPPYIRQEWLSPYKEYLARHYRAFSGTADLYIYFIERGLQLLRPRGRLGFITSGTFARGNFAVPYRQWLPTVARFTSLVNFGENQPFEDAEMVYPTISTFIKEPGPGRFPTLFLNEKIPADLSEEMEAKALYCDETVFDAAEWKFQPKDITALFDRVMNAGRPLGEVCGGKIYYGIKTGLNDAFIIDTPTRDALVKKDARSAELLRPILKGEDLRPWHQDWEGRWLIFSRRGTNIDDYPAVKEYLEQYRDKLEPRPLNWKGSTESWPGRKPGNYPWFELQDSIDYYAEFDQPKIMWAEIAKLPRFSWDDQKYCVINKGYIIPNASPWLLALAQSRVLWFVLAQICTPLRLRGGYWQYQCIHQQVSRLPIPPLAPDDEAALSRLATDITALARERHALHGRVRHRILTDLIPRDGRLNNALTTWWQLDFRAFRNEIIRLAKADIHLRERAQWEAAMSEWGADHARLTSQIAAMEQEVNERVYRLFGLNDEDVRLLENFMEQTQILYPLGEI